jgi:hypothetical protein
MDRFHFWRCWLLVASVALSLQGLTWIYWGSFDPFGIYDGMLAKSLFGSEVFTPEAKVAFAYAVSLLGATDAAFFLLFTFIVMFPFAKREKWSHAAVSSALLLWFVFDSGFSAHVGAWFNIFLVNLPCLIVLGIPLVVTAKDFYGQPIDGQPNDEPKSR